MAKPVYLAASFNDSSLSPDVSYRRRVSAEYVGFGGYNRTAMARVSRSSSRFATEDATDNADDVSLSATFNDSVSVATKRTKRTWDGVFLPVSISIFGVVLFFRLPWIVGECGLWLTLVGIVLSFLVTLLATCSLAAISTNGYVGDGGVYMMVSRCLGPQMGVTVGMTLVLANTLASAMYLVGSVEAVIKSLGNDTLLRWLETQTYGVTVGASSLTLLFLLLVSFLKLDKVFRLICFTLTFAALLNFIISAFVRTTPFPSQGYTTVSGETLRRNWSPDFTEGTNFQKALYVLFPGVCGLMSGVSCSGELKNGPKAIPKGIMYAWLLSFATYLVTAVVVAASFERKFLKKDYHILGRASFEPLFIPGIFCASFAAVLSGMVGSSRVLSAIATDGIMPFWFFRWMARFRPKGRLQISLLVLYTCIQVILFFGNTYTLVSAFTTQVFLVTFVALSLSVFLSSALGITSFRPVFSFFNTLTALIGALASLALMFFIQPIMAFSVLLFMFIAFVLVDLYIDLSKVYWGDASQPLMFHLVRKFLLRLDERKAHVRHWRPSIVHVVTDPLCSLNLIHLANNLKKGGLYEVCFVLRGEFGVTTKAVFRWKGWLMDFIEASGIKAFPVVMSAEELRPAVQSMLRLCGLGSMRPNTVLLSMDEILQREHFQTIYKAYKSNVGAALAIDGHQRVQFVGEGAKDGRLHRVERCQEQVSSVSLKAPCDAEGQSHEKDARSNPPESSPVQIIESPGKTIRIGSFPASYRHRGILCEDSSLLGAGSGVATASVAKDHPMGVRSCVSDEKKRLFSPLDVDGVLSSLLLPPEVHTLQEDASVDKREVQNSEDDLSNIDNNWSEWLKQSMWGKKGLTQDSVSTECGASTTMQRRESASPPEEVPKGTARVGEGDEGQWTKRAHAYRTKRPFRWGLFRSGRTNADEDEEQRLVEQMVAHRHRSQLKSEVDLAGYRDKTEFCCIARDAANAYMNVVIASNMDLLDTDAIEKKGKERKWFIDVWMPEENDATLFLMAHCFCLTSVWKRHAVVRVVSVVTTNKEVQQEVHDIRSMLKLHRLAAHPRVVTLEEEMIRSGVSDIATMERRFDDPQTRPVVINALVHAEIEQTQQRVAVLMMRVPPFAPVREEVGDSSALAVQAEAWFDSLRVMTSRLPPCLVLAGGALRCRSTDW
ncbi:putative solute carrier family 12 member 9-like [Trypanosoma grayi]|uniref:putative solute carrier family 12 member 9-like n=1 Tax=Trypanosoma grayi TaxID=71804 RepID=UPI0004F46EB6|nr:putative solute carrier family 12 member 9-like [Trypanosoma grayi]KEG14554.1 putative solute carrier family 12 member 9-like [Trypanosoma grayi]